MSAKDFVSKAWNNTKAWLSDNFGPTSAHAYYGRADAISGAQPASGSSYPANAGLYGDGSYADLGYVMYSRPFGSSGSNTLFNFGANFARDLPSSGNPGSGNPGSGNSESGYYYPGDSSGSPGQIELNYPNAALAQLYGMDAPTAYQEALANTAIQRRMMDYKAAGLNPVLAAHYNSGADSFSGSALSVVSGASGGSGYIPISAGNGSSAKGFSTLMKNSDYRSALASLASAGVMAVTGKFQYGAAAYYGVKGWLNSKYGRR